MEITRFINMIAACAVLGTAGLLLPSPATAQPVMMEGEDEEGAEFSENYYMTLPAEIGIVLLRQHELPRGEFVIRLSATSGMMDCAKRSALNIETSYDGPYMDIKVRDFRVDAREKPRNPMDCSRATQIPSGDVLLNKNTLEAQNIRYVRFHYGPLIDTYRLQMDQHSVTLEPMKRPGKSHMDANRYQGFNAYGISTPLQLWFYPQDTIILYAPRTPEGVDMEAEITRLATGRGLLPLESRIGDYRVAQTTPPQYYFVDPQNMYLKELAEQDSAPFAPLSVTREVYGLYGDELVREDVQVYMKKPELYE